MSDKDTLTALWSRAADKRSKVEMRAGAPGGGLIIAADRTGPECRVEFARAGKRPSTLEISIYKAHLPIPSNVEPVHSVRNGYHVETFAWPNPAPPQPTLALELAPIVAAPAADGEDDSLDARFERFHAANPHVFAALETLAMDLYRSGVRSFGVKLLTEQLRWQYALATAGDNFKLNNNWPSRYARLLVQAHPELRGVIELRELRS